MFKRFLAVCLAAVLTLSCAFFASAEVNAAAVNPADYFTNRDLAGDWEEDEARQIELSESITIDEAGVYVLSGTIADGRVIVKVSGDDKVQLVLNGVSITCSDGPCILINNADKVFITLAEGTENTLTSTGFAEGDEADGAVFSKDDIVFNGEGKLIITSAKHGIAGNDDVKFGGGEYVIYAKERGINAKDSVRIFDGSYTVYSGKTPIRAKNKKNEEKGYVLILGGTFYLHTELDED